MTEKKRDGFLDGQASRIDGHPPDDAADHKAAPTEPTIPVANGRPRLAGFRGGCRCYKGQPGCGPFFATVLTLCWRGTGEEDSQFRRSLCRRHHDLTGSAKCW